MAYQHFKLSSAGRLATIIAISFVACSSFAGNIVSDGGALGPGVATAPSGARWSISSHRRIGAVP
ncbi:hypothetical protein O0544_01605 [Edwardsiella anguillarum]|nr:hypothetical protein [Edwardsiella anguillarum]